MALKFLFHSKHSVRCDVVRETSNERPYGDYSDLMKFQPTGNTVILHVSNEDLYNIVVFSAWNWFQTQTKTVQETILVEVCDEDKDRYRFGYAGGEKINEWAGIGNNVDLGERAQDTRTGRLGGKPDPKANKYPSLSPYSFAANSPILFKDPNGKEIVITGREAQSVIEQLNSRYAGQVIFGIDEAGKVSAAYGYAHISDVPRLSEEATFMLQAVNDKDIKVNVATFAKDERYRGPDNPVRNLGSFMGNTVEKNYGKTTVQTRQEVMPTLLKDMDKYYDAKDGTGVTHEILESYVGGLNSKESGISAPDSKTDEPTYLKAHNDKRVPEQSGDIYNRYYDVEGKEVSPDSPEIKSATQSFEKEGKEPEVILELRKK